jgi:hypothetical protein
MRARHTFHTRDLHVNHACMHSQMGGYLFYDILGNGATEDRSCKGQSPDGLGYEITKYLNVMYICEWKGGA